jgi:hypothetical protein
LDPDPVRILVLFEDPYPCQNPIDPEHWYGDIFSAYERLKVLLSVKVEEGGI